MSIGSTLDNQAILLVASIAALFVIPMVLWILVTIVGLLGRLFGRPVGTPATVVFIGGLLAALIGVSLALDRDGQVLPAQVVDKVERVRIDQDGGWQQDWSIVARYDVAGKPLPPFTDKVSALFATNRPNGTIEIVTLSVDPALFDSMRRHDALALRVLRVGGVFSFVRLESQSTASIVPWQLLPIAALVLGLVALGWVLRRARIGQGLLVLLVVGALLYPLGRAMAEWRRHEDFSGFSETATATVTQVDRVEEISVGEESGQVRLAQPYDVLQLTIVPSADRDPILAVDAVDVAPGQPDPFEKGEPVRIVYNPRSPREARVVGQGRTHYWQTTLGVYREYAFVLAGIVALSLVLGWLGSRMRQWFLKRLLS
jgi:hypothetical protein